MTWDTMTEQQRINLAMLIGWRTNAGGLNPTGRKVVASSWEQLSLAAQALIARNLP